MDKLNQFLSESAAARKVTVGTEVVFSHIRLTLGEVENLRSAGILGPVSTDMVELDAGGMTLARGRLVEQEGQVYFQVTEKCC